jgi:diguanylate cyclase (GGDEF)-like protein/putative nucleotidyltransferase with HDIG domain
LNVWALIPLLTCICYLLLSIASIPQLKGQVNKVFSFYLIVSSFWSFYAFMLHFESPSVSTLLWNQIVVIFLALALISYYHFAIVYTKSTNKLYLYIGYLLVAFLEFASLKGYVVKYSYIENGVLYHDLGYSIYIIISIAMLYVFAVMFKLFNNYSNSNDPIERNRVLYLISGWVILVTMTLSNAFSALANLPLDHIGNLINALIISYTIFKFNLLNIQTIFRKLLTYIIVIGTLFAATILGFFINPDFFINLPLFLIVIILSLIYIFVILASAPLIKFVSKGVDYLFYRNTYDYRQDLLNFNKKMSHILNLDELAKEILPTISKALNVTGAGLMLQDNKTGNFETQFIYPEDSNNAQEPVFKKISFEADSAIILWMDKKEKAISPEQIDTIPELRGLWQSEKEKIMASDIGLFFPFKSRDKLIGILALGKKKNKSILSYQDIELISNIANQAGIIIENAQLYTHAKIKANTDELTSLYNHRHFHERLDQEIIRNTRFGGTFSLIMMDVDLFKSYNDIYGHLAGDNVLRKVGEYIVNSIRGIDLAFRYGGEEFAVILPGTQIEDAYKVAERIRKTIEAKSSLKAMPITISLGVSNWPSDGIMKEEIIGRADEALYLAKQLGRNRTCMSTDIKEQQNTQLISTELRSNPKALSIIYALAATVDAKDSYTYGHSRKVSEYAIAIAESLKLSNEKVDSIRSAGLLHDIGKIGIPDYILNKNTYLSSEEGQLIKRHPKIGAEILKHVIDLVSCIPAILHHHERYDGMGYPSGLTGENIPIEARILSVADAYDAMVSLRPYRKQLSFQEAIDELKNCSGSQFDPVIVDTFVKIMQKKNTEAIAYNKDEYVSKLKDNKTSN